jgi:cytohesin
MIVGDVAVYVAPDGTWGCFGCGFDKDSAPTEHDDAVFAQTALANFPPTGYPQSMNRKPANPLHEAGEMNRDIKAMNTRFFFGRLCHSSILRRAAVMLVTLSWSSFAFCGEIHDAAKSGDLEKVKALLKDKPNLVFSKDKKGDTPLLVAVKFGHKDVAAFLLAHKANVNAKGKDEAFTGEGFQGKSLGGTPLHWAAMKSDTGMAELLLANGADVNAKDDGTPLHWAVSPTHHKPVSACKEMMELLLANGANVNAKDEDGQTPLHRAAWIHQTEMAELLLAHKADVNAKDNDDETPLHLAVAHWGDTEQDIVKLLLVKGAEINARNKEGDTPLLLVAKYCTGDISMAEFLVANGADVNAKDKKGYTALTIPKDYACPKLIELLQENGAHGSVRADADIFDAVSNGDAEAVKALLKNNPRLAYTERGDGNTPLDLAALYGLKDIVKLLATDKTSANARNSAGMTPLHYAARQGQKDVVVWLLAKGADVNAKDNLGWTPLHQAAWGCAKDVAELLLAHGADINATNNDGWTPLHWAAKDGCDDEVEFLLAKNAEVNATNNDGETPLRLSHNFNRRVTDLLRQHGGHE